MKKKFCLALLLIAAMCLSVAGAALANPELEGTWRMGDGGGTLTITPDSGSPASETVVARGSMRLIISEVEVGGGGEGSLTLSSRGKYDILLEDGTLLVEDVEWTLEPGSFTFTEDPADLFTIVEDIPIPGIEASLVIELKSAASAEVTLSISYEEVGVVAMEGDLEFNATKVSSNSSSSGGCDTGAGFGLFLALGALAVFKRAKRKA